MTPPASAFDQHPAVMAAALRRRRRLDHDPRRRKQPDAERSRVQGSVSRSRDNDPTLGTRGTDQASVIGALNQPIYDGGQAASQRRCVRPRKFKPQRRVILDHFRGQAGTAVVAHGWRTRARRSP